MIQNYIPPRLAETDSLAFFLRLGFGALFISGGWNKLYQLFDPSRQEGILNSYLGAHGYINEFFIQYFFSSPDAVLTPWTFLTALSAFELITGLMLVAGLLVRPIALIYAFLLWTFVIALPVVTTPGASSEAVTFNAPSIFVQIRDISLSGLMFLLFNLGSGRWSLDERYLGTIGNPTSLGWDPLGLLLRFSLGGLFIVSGVFGFAADVPNFATPGIITFVLGLVILSGHGTRYAGIVVMAIMLWVIVSKLGFDRSLIANLNSFKREMAFLAAGLVLTLKGGGGLYTLMDVIERITGKTKSAQS